MQKPTWSVVCEIMLSALEEYIASPFTDEELDELWEKNDCEEYYYASKKYLEEIHNAASAIFDWCTTCKLRESIEESSENFPTPSEADRSLLNALDGALIWPTEYIKDIEETLQRRGLVTPLEFKTLKLREARRVRRRSEENMTEQQEVELAHRLNCSVKDLRGIPDGVFNRHIDEIFNDRTWSKIKQQLDNEREAD